MRFLSQTLIGLAAISTVQAQPHRSSCTAGATARPAATADAGQSFYRDLLSAPTAIQRFRRLLVDGEGLRIGDALKSLIVFDFNDSQPAPGAMGGSSKAATIETYPFSTGLDISMTAVFLEPCGINTPHIHPRAAEFLVLVEGSTLRFGSVLENGLVEAGQNQEIAGTLSKLQGTAFPQGSMHWQFNDGCEKAVMVAALNSNDPGTSQMAQNLFSLSTGILNATLGFPNAIGGSRIEDFRKSIPANLAQDVKNCLARCSPQQSTQ